MHTVTSTATCSALFHAQLRMASKVRIDSSPLIKIAPISHKDFNDSYVGRNLLSLPCPYRRDCLSVDCELGHYLRRLNLRNVDLSSHRHFVPVVL